LGSVPLGEYLFFPLLFFFLSFLPSFRDPPSPRDFDIVRNTLFFLRMRFSRRFSPLSPFVFFSELLLRRSFPFGPKVFHVLKVGRPPGFFFFFFYTSLDKGLCLFSPPSLPFTSIYIPLVRTDVYKLFALSFRLSNHSDSPLSLSFFFPLPNGSLPCHGVHPSRGDLSDPFCSQKSWDGGVFSFIRCSFFRPLVKEFFSFFSVVFLRTWGRLVFEGDLDFFFRTLRLSFSLFLRALD